jgi:dihydrofolate reductase
MRKIFTFLVSTVDGYYEGANGEFDWPVVDDEFNDFAIEQLDEIGTLLFGRVTYLGMSSYWPTEQAQRDDPRTAGYMNAIDKIAVSNTLTSADWANSRLLAGDVAGELTRLKQQPGKALAVFGSSNLTVSLIEHGLVDEVRIMTMPIVLGAGRSLFHTARSRIRLELLDVRPFKSGNVLLTYRPVG